MSSGKASVIDESRLVLSAIASHTTGRARVVGMSGPQGLAIVFRGVNELDGAADAPGESSIAEHAASTAEQTATPLMMRRLRGCEGWGWEG
jgi:hypothetical protein